MVDKAIEIALAIVASVGGFGVVFSAVVYFTSNFIAERLQKKYELKLNERFEKYKAGIENKTYISKTKFDAEFALYRSLSKAFFDMIKNISVMIPQGYTTVVDHRIFLQLPSCRSLFQYNRQQDLYPYPQKHG